MSRRLSRSDVYTNVTWQKLTMNNSENEFMDSRSSYENCSNVIERLTLWKSELESKLKTNPTDVSIHGLISEIELSIERLNLLAGTEIYNSKPAISRLEDTVDEYDYRLMCEWGYSDRNKWTDAKFEDQEIKVKAGDYIISM